MELSIGQESRIKRLGYSAQQCKCPEGKVCVNPCRSVSNQMIRGWGWFEHIQRTQRPAGTEKPGG